MSSKINAFDTLYKKCQNKEFLRIYSKFSALSYHLVEPKGIYPFRSSNVSYFITIVKNLKKFKEADLEELSKFISSLEYDDCLSLGLIQTQCFECSEQKYCERLHWSLSYISP